MKNLIIKAKAKVNLGLQVLRKRNDGYHEINSVMMKISAADELIFEESDKLEFSCLPNLNIDIKENLIYKTAILLQKKLESKSFNAKITLRKKTPVGAGIGGGSADAAAVLKFLPVFCGIDISENDIYEIAQSLGSDIPFFIGGNTAVARGRGELLEYFDLKLPYWMLIINPGIFVSTAMAYSGLKFGNKEKKPKDFQQILTGHIEKPDILRKEIINDFEESIFVNFPQIAAIKADLYNSGAVFALMSGSGSSVFGLFDSPEKAELSMLKFSKYWTYICEPIV